MATKTAKVAVTMRHSLDALRQLQSLPLDAKVRMTRLRSRVFYDRFDGKVYLAWSGGLDSTVLRHILRAMGLDIEDVFFDTGLEYPENRDLVKAGGAILIQPKMKFVAVIDKYGYPVVSKRTAQYLHEVRTARGDTATRRLRLTGINSAGKYSELSMIPKKWQFLIRAPFKISHKCCDALKKRPARDYEKASGQHPILGNRADESQQRIQTWRRFGCNAFDVKRPYSTPLGFWTDADIREYIEAEGVEYSALYDMGYKRSGCMFCMFGIHLDKTPNRFQRMKATHPKQWRYCTETLGCRRVLDYIGVDCDEGPLLCASKDLANE